MNDVFEKYGIREGECYEVSFDGCPTQMMTDFEQGSVSDIWIRGIKKLDGRCIQITSYGTRKGMPYVGCSDTDRIIPLDCLTVYNMPEINDDEEVRFFDT